MDLYTRGLVFCHREAAVEQFAVYTRPQGDDTRSSLAEMDDAGGRAMGAAGFCLLGAAGENALLCLYNMSGGAEPPGSSHAGCFSGQGWLLVILA